VIVFLEVVRHVDTARDRSVHRQLSLHLISSFDEVVLVHVVPEVRLDREATLETIIIRARWWPHAVTAHIDRCDLMLQVVSDVLLTRRMDKSHIVCVLVYIARVSTVAGATSLSIHHNLCV